jgi:hypothetical protein
LLILAFGTLTPGRKTLRDALLFASKNAAAMREVGSCGGGAMQVHRKEVSYRHAVVYTILIGVIGALLLVISHLIKVTEYGFASEVLRDFGMVLLPIFVVGLVYELALRRQFDGSLSRILNGMAANNSFIQLVFQEQRYDKMAEVIESARETLVIVGSSPLLEFYKSPEVLIKKFATLRSVTIAYLPPEATHLQSRIVQSGDADIRPELQTHQLLIDRLKAELPAGKVEFVAYDLPPAEFFYICDDRMLLFTWYPLGRPGEQSPCLFVDDLQKTKDSRKFLDYFMSSSKFIRMKSNAAHKAATKVDSFKASLFDTATSAAHRGKNLADGSKAPDLQP